MFHVPLTRSPAPVSSRPTFSWLFFYSWIICFLTDEFSNTREKVSFTWEKEAFLARSKTENLINCFG